MRNTGGAPLNWIRENVGIVAFAVLLVVHRACKLYTRKLQEKLYAPLQRFGSFVISYPELEKHDYSYNGRADDSHYVKKRRIGVEFLVIRSADLASKLGARFECFENSTFVARTIAFSCTLFGISRVNAEYGKLLDKVLANDDYEAVKNEVTKSTSDGDEQRRPRGKVDHPDAENADDELIEMARRSGQLNPVQTRAEERTELRHTGNGNDVANSKNDTMTENSDNRTARTTNRTSLTKSYELLLAKSFPLIRHCIKELIILLEAKSNRKDVVDVKGYCHRHAVNVLGVCVFGKKINELTNSRCDFYDRCDEIFEFWTHSEKHRLRKYVDSVLVNIGILEIEKPVTAVKYFTKLVRDCFQGRHEGYENCLANVLADKLKNSDESIELTASFLIAFSMNMLEVMGGVMSLMLHELSENGELQERIRNNDKVDFDLEGVPRLNLENTGRSTLTDFHIKKTFKTHPIDPVIQLTCKQPYSIPETNIQINPKCVVLIPEHVLQIDNNPYHRTDSFDPADTGRKTEEECVFITDPQIQSVSVFVRKFVDMCLKTSLTSLIQEYEFKTDIELNYANVTSCRFSTLPSTLPLRAARVEKRGKVVIFEESLRAFYASKDVPFLSKIGL